MTDGWWIYAIGFLAQAFFSARILIQWIQSERKRRIMTPSSYWYCSIAGSWLLFLYGYLRQDFAICLGQFISYYIYLYNLNLKGIYERMPSSVKIILLATPLVILAEIVLRAKVLAVSFLQNDEIPLWLLVFGSMAQAIFSLRFIYQWIYSARRQESALPVGFWIMSLTGSAMIVIYGLVRLDPVLVLGQSVGFVAYARNISLGKNNRKNEE